MTEYAQGERYGVKERIPAPRNEIMRDARLNKVVSRAVLLMRHP